MSPPTPVPSFQSATLEAIARILADTSTGLTGSEIGHVLAECGVADIDPTNTKWKRLFNALGSRQNQTSTGNHVVAFIHKSMKPARWLGRVSEFNDKRSELNRALALAGLQLDESGQVRPARIAVTVQEAEERAGRLRTKLRDRGVHEDVLKFCRAELLQENYFHAVLEAMKSVAEKLRRISELTSDGADLAREALSPGKQARPIIAINELKTDTELGEQRGFCNLLIGLFGTFRNPPAHAPKIYWPIDERDALDILSTVSLVHRKLDKARKL